MTDYSTQENDKATYAEDSFAIVPHEWLKLGRTKLRLMISIALVHRPGRRAYIQNRELADECGVTRPVISNHLRDLKADGLILDYGRDGRQYGRLWFTLPEPAGRVFRFDRELLDLDVKGVDVFALAFFAYVKSTGYKVWFESTAKVAAKFGVTTKRIQQAKRRLIAAGMAVLLPGARGFMAFGLLPLFGVPRITRVKDDKINRRRTVVEKAVVAVRKVVGRPDPSNRSKKFRRNDALANAIHLAFGKKFDVVRSRVAAKQILAIRGFDRIPIELFTSEVRLCGGMTPTDLSKNVKRYPWLAWATFPNAEGELNRLYSPIEEMPEPVMRCSMVD